MLAPLILEHVASEVDEVDVWKDTNILRRLSND